MGIGNKLKSLFKITSNTTEINDTTQKFEQLLELIMKEAKGEDNFHYWYDVTLSKSESYKDLQSKDVSYKKEIVRYIIPRINDLNILKRKFQNRRDNNYSTKQDAYLDILKGLLRRDLKFTPKEIFDVLSAFKESADEAKVGFATWPVTYAVQQIERKTKSKPLSEEMNHYLKEILAWKQMNQTKNYWGSDIEKIKVKIEKMVFESENTDGRIAPYILPDDGFGSFVNAEVTNLGDDQQDNLFALFHLFLKASSSKPSQTFLKKINVIIDDIGLPQYKNIIHPFLENFISLKEIEMTHSNGWVYYKFLEEKNHILLKGMVWSLSRFHDTKTLNLVAKVTERCFKKIPSVGPAAAGVGNACIYVLGTTKGLEGISHLSRLKLRIKQTNTRKLIEKYLDIASAKMGISTSEIEELSIPDFGLTLGKRIENFEDYQFVIEVEDVGKIKSSWIKPDGKEQKTIPTFIKESTKYNTKLKKIKADIAKIKKYLTAQRDRIDRTYLEDRIWSLPDFEKYYLHHGLVSFISRKLIWEFKLKSSWIAAIYVNDSWLDIDGKELSINENIQVRLWHPCTVETAAVLQWRERLEEIEIKQPLKQAYREVYILTDAEINTKTYSNRMAAHLLKQHQFNALAKLRGWQYSLMGAFDHGGIGNAIIDIKAHQMRAEFWINELNAEDAMTDVGMWMYVATDQVRFTREDGTLIDLIDIPKVVFSEIMRNVDLFVGVASVGNDPEWRDNGGIPQYRDYWTSYSFGDLNEIAKTRKIILEKLLPRLKISKVSHINGKFLVVKGSVRTYKIHIGSTNILMEPNDQYLCIVPDRSAPKTPSNVFLPFEGDRGLSLILSKAFLLAEDSKVTDTTILSQIHG